MPGKQSIKRKSIKAKWKKKDTNISSKFIIQSSKFMYTSQILWLLALPVSILVAYRLVLIVLKEYEKKIPQENKINSGEN